MTVADTQDSANDGARLRTRHQLPVYSIRLVKRAVPAPQIKALGLCTAEETGLREMRCQRTL
jgi:hypothetical protein